MQNNIQSGHTVLTNKTPSIHFNVKKWLGGIGITRELFGLFDDF